MSKNSNVVCRCSACRSCMGPPPRDRRALADAIGDLVAEATEDHSEADRIDAMTEADVRWLDEENVLPWRLGLASNLRADGATHCPADCMCRAPRTFNAATYTVLGDDW